MSRTRRNFSAKFKSELVIELLKGEKDLNTIASENNIQPNLRQQLLGILRQAVSAVAEAGVVVVTTNTRIKANTIDDLLSIQSLLEK